jgi:tetratricopeptide (TPR) repeat protein
LTNRAGQDVILRAGARQLVNVATTIIYTAQDYVDDPISKNIRSWFRQLVLSPREIDLEIREEILRMMPAPSSLALREEAESLLSGVLEGKRASGGGHVGRMATPQLLEFSLRLSAGGKSQKALAAAEEAVNTSRYVKDRLRRAHYPDLQNSLMVYAEALSEVGRWPEALTAAEEGVGLIRGQYSFGQMDDDGRKDLCWTLLCLGDILAGNERHDEALAIGAESLQIARSMKELDPESQSRALLNYANRLFDAQRFEEAVAHGLEALSLYRELAASSAHAHLKVLGYINQCLSSYCLAAGRTAEAVAYAEEVVTVQRRVARTDPVYQQYLVGSLETLDSLLALVGRGGESVRRELEEIALQEDQADTSPNQ